MVAGGSTPPIPSSQFGAYVVLACRYGLIHRLVEHELRHWKQLADTIVDPRRRAHALGKVQDAWIHARLNVTPVARTRRRHRSKAVVASIALEVMYDYLDALTEQESELRTALSRYSALVLPFSDDRIATIEDEYVRELATASRLAFRALPGHAAVAPLCREVARRSAETQARCHVSSPEDFARWASSRPKPPDLRWWEAAAGWSAEVMTLHALIALATDEVAVGAANRLTAAYQRICSVATLLDSLVDLETDRRSGGHSYVGYYESDEIASRRIASVAESALSAVALLPGAPHHTLTVTAIVAYFLTTPEASASSISIDPVRETLGWPLRMLTAMFRLKRRLWRPIFPPRYAAR